LIGPNSDHRHGLPGQIEKLDTVTLFPRGVGMPLDGHTHVPGAEAVLRKIGGENDVSKELE
jgi:hypothetical protein